MIALKTVAWKISFARSESIWLAALWKFSPRLEAPSIRSLKKFTVQPAKIVKSATFCGETRL